jgi:multidrug resistance protein
MVTTGLTAIDATILATAVPTLVAELGSFELFPWLFSIYLLAQAVSTPLFAKFSDMVGRKPIILIGISLFLVGSILCGLAWDMPALIAFRAVQGIGAGAIGPMAMTIVGDIYSVKERAKVQGYIASVWAASAVVGPTLGGLFAELDAWRWIFFINIPLCLLAGWMLIRSLHETVERRPHRVDVLGALLLASSLGLLLVGVLQGNVSWPWASWQSAVAFGLGGALLTAFVFVERRAAEPILPGWVFSRRLLLTTTLVSVGVGAILIGLASYVPVTLEAALGISPLVAGLALAALTIGWPISAALSGRLYLTLGFRTTVLIGTGFLLAGTGLLAAFASTPSIVVAAIACFITGLGLGFVATPSLVAAQASVQWNERGVVTGTNLFARAVGQAVAVAIFGAVANTLYRAAGGGGALGEGSSAVVDPLAIIPAAQAVFVGALLCAVATAIVAAAMPDDRPSRRIPVARPEHAARLEPAVRSESAARPEPALSAEPMVPPAP